MSAAITRHEHHAEIVRTESYEGMTLAVSPAEAARRVQELQAFVKTVMRENEDFGVIPGTDKPSLYQPGAQKLAEIYGLAHHFEPIETVKDWERGFFYFEYRCVVTSRRDGRHICEGIGSCNSRESKYGERWVFDRDIPAGMNRAALKTKKITSRKDRREYTMYQVPNPDPYSLVNTLQKMAAKRAYVHAIISATRSAGVFTQDVEDIPKEAFGQAEEHRSWEDDGPQEAPKAKSEPPPAIQPRPASLMMLAIADTKTLDGLKDVWGEVLKAAKKGAITLDERAKLQDAKDARKAELGRMPPPEPAEKVLADNPMPEGWGGDGPQDESAGEQCLVCGVRIDAGGVPTHGPDGEVRYRHGGCSPFGVGREPGEEG